VIELFQHQSRDNTELSSTLCTSI